MDALNDSPVMDASTGWDFDIPAMAADDTGCEAATGVEPEAPQSAAPDAPAPKGRPSFCVAFNGVTGGVGVTSLAVETAHVFAQAKRGEVCLVDLDFELGMCGHYLGVTTPPTLDDYRADPARVDANYVRAMLAHHDSGFAVLAAPGGPAANERVNPPTVLAVLDALADLYNVVVLDVPRLTRPWTEAALLAADRVCLMTELTIPALHMTRLRMGEFRTAGVSRTDVVLGRCEKRSFRASIRKADAERVIGQEVAGVIGLDRHTVSEAMNCGVPAGVATKDSRFSKDVGKLARELSPHFAERRRSRR